MSYIKSIKYLTQNELNSLLRVIDDNNHSNKLGPYENMSLKKRNLAIFLLAYKHGLRACEVGRLKLEDVDLDQGRIRIERAKGSFGGEHIMQVDEVRAVQAWLLKRKTEFSKRTLRKVSNSPYLFPSINGTPITRRMLDFFMKRYGKKAGIPLDKRHFHVLKHSIATHLLEAGADIMFIREWLGHRNINNTLIYAQLTSRARDEQAMKIFTSPKIVGLGIHSTDFTTGTLTCRSCGLPLVARNFNKAYCVYQCENPGCQCYQEPQQSKRKSGQTFEDIGKQRLMELVIKPPKKVGTLVP